MKTHLTWTLALVASIALVGCEVLNPQSFAPATLSKDANVTCITYDTITVDVGVMSVNVDKGVIDAGELDVKCGGNSVKYTNAKAAK